MPKIILTDENGVSTATASFDPKSDFNDSDYWQNKKKSKNSLATRPKVPVNKKNLPGMREK
ncbi:MAG: hypothetical protein GXO70_08900 [Acidobacteria bacterium]|nr:hypothetical protein [Acidobacteriota bacterium]